MTNYITEPTCLITSPSKTSLPSWVCCIGSRHPTHRHTLKMPTEASLLTWRLLVSKVAFALGWEQTHGQFQSSADAQELLGSDWVMWKLGYLRDVADSSKPNILGWAMARLLLLKLHPNLYLDIQSSSGMSAKKQVAPHVHKTTCCPDHPLQT